MERIEHVAGRRMMMRVWMMWVAGVTVVGASVLGAIGDGAVSEPATQTAGSEDTEAVAPTLLTAKLNEAGVADIAKVLTEATGKRFTTLGMGRGANPQAKVTVEFDKTPYFEALAKIDEQMPLRIIPRVNGQEAYGVQQARQRTMSRMSHHGAFAAAPASLQLQRRVDVRTGKISADFVLWLTVTVDPRVRVLRTSTLPELTEAVDDAGNSLIPAKQNKEMMWVEDGFTGTTLEVPFAYPDKPGERIRAVKGRMRYEVVVRSEKGEVEDLEKAKGQKLEVGGLRLELGEVRVEGELMRAPLQVTAIDKNTSTVHGAELVFVDAAGQEARQMQTVGQGIGEVVFPKPPVMPVKLKVVVATKTVEVVAPFEFGAMTMP